MSEPGKQIRVRIFNGGKAAWDTQITDAETGAPIPHVTGFRLDWKAETIYPTIELTVCHPVIDLIADAEIKKICPCCGRSVED